MEALVNKSRAEQTYTRGFRLDDGRFAVMSKKGRSLTKPSSPDFDMPRHKVNRDKVRINGRWEKIDEAIFVAPDGMIHVSQAQTANLYSDHVFPGNVWGFCAQLQRMKVSDLTAIFLEPKTWGMNFYQNGVKK